MRKLICDLHGKPTNQNDARKVGRPCQRWGPPDLTFAELLDGLRRMCNGRSSDPFGIMVEMIKDFSDVFKQKLLDVYIRILVNGDIEDSQYTTLFTMLPKSGGLTDPSNWRPIAILPILYKMFPDCCTID